MEEVGHRLEKIACEVEIEKEKVLLVVLRLHATQIALVQRLHAALVARHPSPRLLASLQQELSVAPFGAIFDYLWRPLSLYWRPLRPYERPQLFL